MSGPAADPKLGSLPSLAPGLRVYAIGDVHGRFDLLATLAAKIRSDLDQSPPAESVEVFLGDYVDRGPQSRDVIEWLVATPPIASRRICLIGNHEDMLLQALDDAAALSNWLYNGGGETLLSYRALVRWGSSGDTWDEMRQAFREAIPDAHLAFLASLTTMATIDPYLFVHAGLRPGVPLADQNPEDLIWIREPFLTSDADFGRIVVHGHTPVREPDVRSNRINIDTGAVFTGRLTCLVLEGGERRFIQATADD